MNHPNIPNNWSPEQALAMLELLDACYNAIWDTYEQPLVDILARDAHSQTIADRQHDADQSSGLDIDPDDDIPF